jgi:hypothetical protein
MMPDALRTIVLLFVLAAAPATAATLRVGTMAELEAALAAARPGTRIELAAVEFRVGRPLLVPDGVTLHGGGRMALGVDGRAAGLLTGSAATLVATGELQGDAVSLGNGSKLQALRIVDHGAGARPAGPGWRNVVSIGSRRAHDRVTATIRDCEIETDQAFGVGRDGPLGRAIVVSTRNLGESGGAHVGARAGLRLLRSVVRASESNALFAINFAAGGRVDLRVEDSVLEGVLSATGGTARPDAVSGARTKLHSRNSRYVRAGRYDRFGWQLNGGSGTPHAGIGSTAGAERNELSVDSRGDAVEGFRVGVQAAAGRRVGTLSGASSGNTLILRLRDLSIEGAGDGSVDFDLFGALAEAPPGGGEAGAVGQGNVLLVDLRGFRRGNGTSRYVSTNDPAGDGGNRVRFVGGPHGFSRSNPGFKQVPAEKFFHR